MNIITPDTNTYSIFLAGTIDDGTGKNWQKEVIEKFSNYETVGVTIFNPRRDNWNPNATEHDILKQIDWEQKHLEEADLIVMCILNGSKSPISLMELGQFASKGNVIVFCPKDFWRQTNVKWICEHYGLDLYETNEIDTIVSIMLESYVGLRFKNS